MELNSEEAHSALSACLEIGAGVPMGSRCLSYFRLECLLGIYVSHKYCDNKWRNLTIVDGRQCCCPVPKSGQKAVQSIGTSQLH